MKQLNILLLNKFNNNNKPVRLNKKNSSEFKINSEIFILFSLLFCIIFLVVGLIFKQPTL